ncbi:MAG: DUF881 domain-containing protein [Fimbriimonadaceae bacterium]
MNPFIQRQSPRGWVVPISILAMMIGMMASLAFLSEGAKSRSAAQNQTGGRGEFVGSQDVSLAKEVVNLREEVSKLREDKTKLETKIAETGNATKEINDSLQDTKIFAALTDLKGQGLIITLSDSKKPSDEMIVESGLVHYLDVLKVVNELFNAGAEAVAVNGLRIGPRTDFRCVGSTILVGTQKIAPPVVIQVVGETKTLLGAMNMPGGILAELRDVDPAMVKVEPAQELTLPAYDGATKFKFGTVPEVKE